MGSPRASAVVTVHNRLGLHARPAMALVDTAVSFASKVEIAKGDLTVDGKSIMQVLMLAATKGATLTVTAEGPDADAACHAICELFNARFGEE